MANFKNKRSRKSASRGGCFCGGKWDKKVTGKDKLRYIDPPEEPRNKSRSRKDRKKWCGGKSGIKHEYRWTLDRQFDHWRKDHEYIYQVQECANCGRINDSGSLHKKCGKMHSRWLLSKDDPCKTAA